MKTLYEKKSLAPNDYKKFETAYTNSQQQYAQAQKGAQQEDKAAAKARVEQAEAAERIVRKRLSDSTLSLRLAALCRSQHRGGGDGESGHRHFYDC